MELLSRRTALRLAGGAAGVGAVVAPGLAGSGAQAVLERGPYTRYRTHPTGMHPVVNRRRPLIGMSAPSGDWDRRVREVGPGLTARRVFADLARGADDQMRTIEEAHRNGMLPVVSYKVGGDINGAVAGAWNQEARRAARNLASFGRPTAVSFWHEPHSDMTTAQFVAANRQIMPHFKRGRLKVGPLLNGFLLDNQEDVFRQYVPDSLIGIFDWIGIDTYEGGTDQDPGPRKPHHRVRALRRHLRSRGRGSMPIGIGEYNGYSGRTVEQAGRSLLATSNVWFGCVWNSNGDRASTLSGERLVAFRRTLADPRSMNPR